MTVTVEGVGEIEIVEGDFVFLDQGSKGEAFVEWEDIKGNTRIASLSAEIESKSRELAQTIKKHLATVTEVHGETYCSLH